MLCFPIEHTPEELKDSSQHTPENPATSPPTRDPDPEPMQIARTRLTPQKRETVYGTTPLVLRRTWSLHLKLSVHHLLFSGRGHSMKSRFSTQGAEASFMCPTLFRPLGVPTSHLKQTLHTPYANFNRSCHSPHLWQPRGDHHILRYEVTTCLHGFGHTLGSLPQPPSRLNSKDHYGLEPQMPNFLPLQSVPGLSASSPMIKKVPLDLPSILAKYHNRGQVFSKGQACSLSPHRSYDCAH